MRALAYQLHERTGFVAPPDPVVGDLVDAYANLTAIEHAIEHALPIYDLALAYRPARAAAVASAPPPWAPDHRPLSARVRDGTARAA